MLHSTYCSSSEWIRIPHFLSWTRPQWYTLFPVPYVESLLWTPPLVSHKVCGRCMWCTGQNVDFIDSLVLTWPQHCSTPQSPPTLRLLFLTSNLSCGLSGVLYHTTSKNNCTSSNRQSDVDTSPERQESPTQGYQSSSNSGSNSHTSSFGGPAPAQQPLMWQFTDTLHPSSIYTLL